MSRISPEVTHSSIAYRRAKRFASVARSLCVKLESCIVENVDVKPATRVHRSEVAPLALQFVEQTRRLSPNLLDSQSQKERPWCRASRSDSP